jgi:hypothetical protein
MRTNFFISGKERGESLLTAVVTTGLVAILIVAATKMMERYNDNTFQSIAAGGEEDLRNYVRESLDCTETLRKEKSICDAGGFIRGFRKNSTALSKNVKSGIRFPRSTVKLFCRKDDWGYSISGTVKHRGSTTERELFELPLVCSVGNCVADPSLPDPYVLNIGDSAGELAKAVSAAAAKCGINMPKFPIRKSFTSAGQGNKWTSYGTDDLTTLKQACWLLGYDNYVSSTCLDGQRKGKYRFGKCHWDSPHDNYDQYYDGTNWQIIDLTRKDKYSSIWTSSLTCSGKR